MLGVDEVLVGQKLQYYIGLIAGRTEAAILYWLIRFIGLIRLIRQIRQIRLIMLIMQLGLIDFIRRIGK